jgi:hypothetical protein
VRAQLNAKLEGDGEREYRRQLYSFEEAGGDEDDFEDPVDWDAIEEKIENIMAGLKSRGPSGAGGLHRRGDRAGRRPAAGPQRATPQQLWHRRHSERLPDLEKRARLLSAEYREVQKSRPIGRRPGRGRLRNDAERTGPKTAAGEGRCRRRTRAGTD